MFFHDAEKVVALHVAHFLAPGDGHDLPLDLQDGRAVGEFDAEAVAGQGEDVFFEDEGFWGLCNELGEEGDGLGNSYEGGHGCGGLREER